MYMHLLCGYTSSWLPQRFSFLCFLSLSNVLCCGVWTNFIPELINGMEKHFQTFNGFLLRNLQKLNVLLKIESSWCQCSIWFVFGIWNIFILCDLINEIVQFMLNLTLYINESFFLLNFMLMSQLYCLNFSNTHFG